MENLFKTRKDRLDTFNKRMTKRNDKFVKEIPNELFIKCEKCGEITASETLANAYKVCPNCNHHQKLSAYERISLLVDDNSFSEFYFDLTTVNDVQFEGYDNKLDIAKKNSGLNEAVVIGEGIINNIKCAMAVMDNSFMMGSMGRVVGEKITLLIEYATKNKIPLIISSTSGGARMQEGTLSLMQMAKTSAALKRHSDANLLYISLLTHPTTGGVSASFAMLGDIIISEPNCLIGFAGKRVIEKTINQVLPDEFQKSEFLLEKGFIDIVVERNKLKDTMGNLLTYHGY